MQITHENGKMQVDLIDLDENCELEYGGLNMI